MSQISSQTDTPAPFKLVAWLTKLDGTYMIEEEDIYTENAESVKVRRSMRDMATLSPYQQERVTRYQMICAPGWSLVGVATDPELSNRRFCALFKRPVNGTVQGA